MRTLAVLALIGSFTVATAAIAATQNEGPEPYSAPDPVYTPHQIDSTVTFKDGKVVQAPANKKDAARPMSGDHS